MKKSLIVLLVASLLFLHSARAVVFNEIMYDVMGSDDNNEWLEIMNEKNFSVNIQNWKLFEGGTNHNIVSVMGGYSIPPKGVAVIAEDPSTFVSTYPNYTGILFDSTFSLSNTGETLVLKNKTGQIQENFTYSYLWGGSEDGYSVGLHNNVWKETLPTPGKTNKVSNVCDWGVSIAYDKLIFDNPTDVSWKIKSQRLLGESSFVTIKRWLEDMYGNSIRTYDDLYHNISNRETLSYDPNLKPGTYLLKTQIIPSCNDTNLVNNFYQVLLAVKDVQETKSSLKIENVYDLGKDNEASFGQLIRIKVNAYKGDSTKNVISLSIEDKDKITKVFKFDIESKFTRQELTIPVQIFPNCDNKLKNGTYDIILDGLGERATSKIKVYGNEKGGCGVVVPEKKMSTTSKTASKSANTSTQSTSSFDSQPSSSKKFNSGKPFALSTIMFESSQKKAENLIPYAAGVIMTTTTVFLALSNKVIP